MLQASCIYLGLVTPCPETDHPLHPPRRLITPCPTASVISTKEYSKYPAWLTFPLSLQQTSLSVWSLPDPFRRLVVRPTVAPPCLNKGNLLLSRSSFLFCLAGTMPYIFGAETWEGVKHSSHSLTLPPCHCFPFSPPESGSADILRAHFSARAPKFPSGTPSAFVSSASLVLRLYWCFAYPQASALPPFSLWRPPE